MLLSIITLTVPGREEQLAALSTKLSKQIADNNYSHSVEHLVVPGPGVYGRKMRRSLEESKGAYVCWIDDDDDVSDDYVASLVSAISRPLPPDVVTFRCCMTGYRNMVLQANRKDNSGYVEDGGEIWAANHYCAWKRSIAMSSVWLPRNYGSETAWYKLISAAYPHLQEFHIPRVLHYYHYDPETTLCQDKKSIEDSLKDDCDDVTLIRVTKKNCVHTGILGIAVGRAQPVGGLYTVTLCDYKFLSLPEHEVEVLERFRYG